MGVGIELKGISFAYDSSNENIFDGVDMKINHGELVLLSGMSGEGKSTLLSIINGIIPYVTQGRLDGIVEIDGVDVGKMKVSERSRLLGTVLQNADEQIVYDLVSDEIAFGCENLNVAVDEIENRITSSCELMKIDKNAKTRTLSGGQKQRLITASTLAMKQRALVLDEPLANLDTNAAHLLLKALRRLADSGYAILLVEHRLDIVKPYVDRVLYIKDKKILRADDFADFAESVRELEYKALGYKSEKVLIKGSGLVFSVGEKNIIDGLDIEIKKGERTVILGENGCGKTTLMRTLSRLNKLSGGELIQTLTSSKKAGSKWFSKVGYVYQNPTYQLFMPTLLSEISYKAKSREAAENMIAALGLAGLEQRHPQSLSEGQKRRAGIAAICAAEPEVLFLDEPTVGQDFENLKRIIDTVNGLNEKTGCAVVTVTHDIRCAAALCDRALIMQNGKIVKSGDGELARKYLKYGKFETNRL